MSERLGIVFGRGSDLGLGRTTKYRSERRSVVPFVEGIGEGTVSQLGHRSKWRPTL